MHDALPIYRDPKKAFKFLKKSLIKELNKSLKRCSDSRVSYQNPIPKTSINERTRKLLAPLDPKVANYLWSPDFIHKILKAYSSFLHNPFDKSLRKEKIQFLEFYEKRLGALKYPKRPANQAHRKNLQENSLIFNLAFLFRHFTKKSNKGHWLPSTKGALPKSGTPNYGLTSEIVNAVFFPTGKETNEDNEFTPQKIRDRVISLTQSNVKLISWFGM